MACIFQQYLIMASLRNDYHEVVERIGHQIYQQLCLTSIVGNEFTSSVDVADSMHTILQKANTLPGHYREAT